MKSLLEIFAIFLLAICWLELFSSRFFVEGFVTPVINQTEEEMAERGNGPLPDWAKDHPERQEFFQSVHNVHVSDGDAAGLRNKWLEQGLSNFIASFANKRVKGAPKPMLLETGECTKRAPRLSDHARCIANLLNGTFTGQKFVEKDRQMLSRFDRYRQRKRQEMVREFRELQEHGKNSIPSVDVVKHQKMLGAKNDENDPLYMEGDKKARRQQLFSKNNRRRRPILGDETEEEEELRRQLMKRKKFNYQSKNKWIGGFRMMDDPIPGGNSGSSSGSEEARNYRLHRRIRRQSGVIKRNHYRLYTPDKGVSPLGSIAKVIMESVLRKKNKTEKAVQPWQMLVKRIEDISERRKSNVDDVENKGEVPSIAALKFKSFRKMKLIPDELLDMMDGDPKKVLAFARKKQSETKPKTLPEKMIAMTRDAVKLGFSLAGHNVSDDETLKLASPRLLSLTPEEDAYGKQRGVASPSLFSLHNRGQGIEQLTSLPNLFSGFSSKDQQAWLDLIFETTNITQEVDRLEEQMGAMDLADMKDSEGKPDVERIRKRMDKVARGKDGTPLYFTKENMTKLNFETYDQRRVGVIEMLERSYTKEQLHEMNTTGYTMFTPEQLEQFYGHESPFSNMDALERFRGMNLSEMETLLEKDIHKVAANPDALRQIPLNRGSDPLPEFDREKKQFHARGAGARGATIDGLQTVEDGGGGVNGYHGKQLIYNENSASRRKRDLILSPVSNTVFTGLAVNTWTVLSPITWVAIVNSPLIIGPTILSPLTFLPIILSPRLIVPVILTPIIFEPLVLSPLVIVPNIIVPGMFNPGILSPYLIVPVILSPGLFSPAILSPGGIGVAVLSPKVGSPLVLSPYFLFPVICSPSALGALVLSPYALSPVYNSPATAFSVILSPSWLSRR